MVNLDIVENILKTKNIRHNRYTNYIMASCMSGKHVDVHPSMIVSSKGHVYCKTCGFKSDIVKLFDIELSIPEEGNSLGNLEMFVTPDYKFSKVEEYNLSNKNMRMFNYPLPINLTLVEANQEKRGISIKTLKEYNVLFSGDWCVFPVEYDSPSGRIRLGYAIRTDNGWVFSKKMENTIHFSQYVYPLINASHTDTLFLVEGMFDALALIDKGFPALAMYGGWVSHNTALTDKNLALKEAFFIAYSPKNIVLFFDEDEAGHSYYRNAARFLSNRYNVVEYKADKDPDEYLLEKSNELKLRDYVISL
jgi:hypothetical protein